MACGKLWVSVGDEVGRKRVMCFVVAVVSIPLQAAVVEVTCLQRRQLDVNRRRRVDKSLGELYQSHPGVLFWCAITVCVGARGAVAKQLKAATTGEMERGKSIR